MGAKRDFVFWQKEELKNSRKSLTELQNAVSQLDGSSELNLVDYMSRFLVVRATGHIEFCLDTATSIYVHKRSSPTIHNYVESSLFKGTNPSPERMKQRFRSLEARLGEQIETVLENNDRLLHDELCLMISRRNAIAHGKSDGIGQARALRLCDYALDISDAICNILND